MRMKTLLGLAFASLVALIGCTGDDPDVSSYAGDLDGNGAIDCHDLDHVVACASDPHLAHCDLADVNHDGHVDEHDVADVHDGLAATGHECTDPHDADGGH
jgi:hypothetical protein